MLKVDFDLLIPLRRGEVIQITEGWSKVGDTIRANVIQNISSNQIFRVSRGLMTDPPKQILPPVTGRVDSIEICNGNHTTVKIEEGKLTEDFIFVKSGEIKKGELALIEIFSSEINEYLKVEDPYLDANSLKLFEKLPEGIKVSILTEKITYPDSIKSVVDKLKNKHIYVKIKKVPEGLLHDRYLFTKGKAWKIGTSLNSLGKSDTSISRIYEKAEPESIFDERYVADGKPVI